jgi:hypothetical protein
VSQRYTFLLRGAWSKHAELVSAKAGTKVTGPQRSRDAPCDVSKSPVARRVAMRVIDRFQPIEVDEEKRQALPGALRSLDLKSQAIAELADVREFRQWVIVRNSTRAVNLAPECCAVRGKHNQGGNRHVEEPHTVTPQFLHALIESHLCHMVLAESRDHQPTRSPQ